MNATNTLAGRKAAYFTLGCKLNFAETSAVGERLKEYGVATAQKGEVADICVVNTCSVTEVADSKCRQAIRQLVRRHPGAFVVVTGCYAQLQPETIGKIEGVDLILGADEKARVVEKIVEHFNGVPFPAIPSQGQGIFFPSCSCGERTRYFLKVQDGCDYFCTYCTIPFARGRSRNGSIASLVEQAREVARKGGREIVITGVNIGDFGKTTGETFLDLIKALDQVEGIDRYRISSIEPNLLTDEIIEFCAWSRAFMPHFHIPLQSGSDEVLRLMHRRYDSALFAQKLAKIKQLMPDAFIGVDVIVGTRGETEELFQQALRFMRSVPVSQYHVFSYSERPGTKALRIPHRVSPEEKHARSQQVLALSDQLTRAFYNKYIGTVRPVLLEHSKRRGILSGWTDNYIKVEVKAEEDNAAIKREQTSLLDLPSGSSVGEANEIVNVRLVGWNKDESALIGEVVK